MKKKKKILILCISVFFFLMLYFILLRVDSMHMREEQHWLRDLIKDEEVTVQEEWVVKQGEDGIYFVYGDKFMYKYRLDLRDLINYLDMHIVYSHTDKDFRFSTYMLYPGADTERRLNIFFDNVSRIYIENQGGGEDKCLLDIIEWKEKGLKNKTVSEKINALIQALTVDSMTNMGVFGRNGYQEGKGATTTGMAILNTLDDLSLEVEDKQEESGGKVVTVNAYIKEEGEKVLITDTDYSDGYNNKTENLFTRPLRKTTIEEESRYEKNVMQPIEVEE